MGAILGAIGPIAGYIGVFLGGVFVGAAGLAVMSFAGGGRVEDAQ